MDDTFFQDGGKEPKVFAEKFLDEEKGRPLWSRWIARQQNGTLDQIDRPRGATKGPKHSWYYVADFETDRGKAKESGSYFKGAVDPKANHAPQWKRWYNPDADELVFYGQEVLHEVLQLLERTMTASKEFDRQKAAERKQLLQAERMSQKHVLNVIEKAIKA